MIRNALVAHQNAGYDLAYSDALGRDPKLVGAAIRHFGSWGAALEDAGIDYASILKASRARRAQRISKWNKEAIVQAIRRLRQRGESLAYSAVKNRHLALLTAACLKRHFGSWRAAVEAAGVSYQEEKERSRGSISHRRRWYRELVREQITFLREQGVNLKRRGTLKRFRALVRVATEAFGSWEKALAAVEPQRR